MLLEEDVAMAVETVPSTPVDPHPLAAGWLPSSEPPPVPTADAETEPAVILPPPPSWPRVFPSL